MTSNELRIIEIAAPDTARAWTAMHELRTHLESEAAFVRAVDEVQRAEGYRLFGAFADDRGEDAIAVAGFRLMHTLFCERFLYVDDLSTRAAFRGRGAASALLDAVVDEARALGCEMVHLDSGTIPERFTAHRLYHDKRFSIVSHHFARPVDA